MTLNYFAYASAMTLNYHICATAHHDGLTSCIFASQNYRCHIGNYLFRERCQMKVLESIFHRPSFHHIQCMQCYKEICLTVTHPLIAIWLK